MNSIDLEQAVECLQQGNVLAYPTEAIWGLGCDPYQEQAFEKILHLKQRKIEKGVILLSESIERIEPLLQQLDPTIRNQVITSWQNHDSMQTRATTWLLPISSEIPAWIYGEHNRVAIRVTAHPLCQQLCKAFDQLIVSTSANPAGLTPAKTVEQVKQYFPSLAILNGQLGSNAEPSRILDAVTGEVVRR